MSDNIVINYGKIMSLSNPSGSGLSCEPFTAPNLISRRGESEGRGQAYSRIITLEDGVPLSSILEE